VPNVLPLPVLGLPSQAGHAGQFLTTDGTVLSWADAGGGLSPPFHAGSPLALVDDGTGPPGVPLAVFGPSAFELNTSDLRAGIIVDETSNFEVVDLFHNDGLGNHVDVGLLFPFVDVHLADPLLNNNSYFAIWDGPGFGAALWSVGHGLSSVRMTDGLGGSSTWDIGATGTTSFQTQNASGTFNAGWTGPGMSFVGQDSDTSVTTRILVGTSAPDGSGFFVDAADAGSGIPVSSLRILPNHIQAGAYGGGANQFFSAYDPGIDVLAELDLYSGGGLLGARDSFLNECYFLATTLGLQGWCGSGASPEEVFAFDVPGTPNDTSMQLSVLISGVRTLHRVVRDPGTGVLSAP
jgi:hypothetical protein